MSTAAGIGWQFACGNKQRRNPSLVASRRRASICATAHFTRQTHFPENHQMRVKRYLSQTRRHGDDYPKSIAGSSMCSPLPH
jgi:hypothetical protein